AAGVSLLISLDGEPAAFPRRSPNLSHPFVSATDALPWAIGARAPALYESVKFSTVGFVQINPVVRAA
ncbi:MAG: hypothetical protein WD942_03300, partial [Dehalococcoidia bacterium]